jgi:hypothetical protein
MRFAPLLAACATVALAHAAAAQCGGAPASANYCAPRSRTAGQVQTVAVNAALGGVTAGVLRVVHGGRFGGAFARGAAGGALTYAGKRIAVRQFDGAGLLGREVAAVGSSVSYNAGAGVPALRRIVLPFGPIRFYLRPGDASPLRVRVDAATVGALAYALLHVDNRLDFGQSLSSGTPVFRRYDDPGNVPWEGVQVAGVVQVRHAPAERMPGFTLSDEVRTYLADVAAHERVHVIQYDQSFLLWAAPAEDAVLDRSRLGRSIHRHVDLGLNVPVWAALNGVVGPNARPWEREAYFLSHSTPDEIGSRPDGR